MFLRPCYRKKNGKRHAYWALIESHRSERGPRQRVVAYLGQLDERGRLGVKEAAEGQRRSRQKRLFDDLEPPWVEVDASRVRVENCRDFGGPWLGLELVRRLGWQEFLRQTIPQGREKIPWSSMALVLVLCRLCYPSSELHIAEHFYAQSALAELLGVPAEKVNEQRLYRALDALLPHQEALEVFLKERLGELFGLEYDLLLYDVTSTYFEGEVHANPLAQRGYSRDHRPDCKQVCIGLVVSRCGMPNGEETLVLCRSRDRREKEKAMHARFEQRIEEGLRRIAATCQRQRLQPAVVGQRVGRLLGRNSRAAGLFAVDVQTDGEGRARLAWRKVEAWRDWAALSEGCYLLRSNIQDWSHEELWKTYIQLTEAEAAFRVQKSDLGIRPIWHQKEQRVLAHILVCFLAYVLWKSLSQWCLRAGLGHQPRRVFEQLGKIRLVDVVLPTRQGMEIRKRCVTRPTDHQAILLQHLGLRLPTRPMADV